jgi:hypothetical protein
MQSSLSAYCKQERARENKKNKKFSKDTVVTFIFSQTNVIASAKSITIMYNLS